MVRQVWEIIHTAYLSEIFKHDSILKVLKNSVLRQNVLANFNSYSFFFFSCDMSYQLKELVLHRTLGHEDIMGTSGAGDYENTFSSKVNLGTSGSVLPLRLCLLICKFSKSIYHFR